MKKLTLIVSLMLMSGLMVFAQSGTKPAAPAFSVVSMAKKTFDLAELKDKVVVVTFWSTRCAVCAAEMPKLNKMVAELRGRDVVFLAVTAENADKVEKFLKKNPFDFNIIPNGIELVLKFADKDKDGSVTMPTPTHYLIDQTGRIEAKIVGYDKKDDLGTGVKRLLAKKPAE